MLTPIFLNCALHKRNVYGYKPRDNIKADKTIFSLIEIEIKLTSSAVPTKIKAYT